VIEEAWDLFRAPPAEFVAARDELVRRLRAEKRKDDAAEVKALRRPTPTLWALNQLSDSDAEGVEELREAGRATRAAQEAARGVKEADARLRSAVAHLTRVALQSMTERSVAANPSRQEIESALRAAAADERVAQALGSGRLLELPAPPDELAMWSVGPTPSETSEAETDEVTLAAAPEGPDPALVSAARQEVEEGSRRVHRLQRQVEVALEDLAAARARLAELERGPA
jgi:hypothetical protein